MPLSQTDEHVASVRAFLPTISEARAAVLERRIDVHVCPDCGRRCPRWPGGRTQLHRYVLAEVTDEIVERARVALNESVSFHVLTRAAVGHPEAEEEIVRVVAGALGLPVVASSTSRSSEESS